MNCYLLPLNFSLALNSSLYIKELICVPSNQLPDYNNGVRIQPRIQTKNYVSEAYILFAPHTQTRAIAKIVGITVRLRHRLN